MDSGPIALNFLLGSKAQSASMNCHSFIRISYNATLLVILFFLINLFLEGVFVTSGRKVRSPSLPSIFLNCPKMQSLLLPGYSDKYDLRLSHDIITEESFSEISPTTVDIDTGKGGQFSRLYKNSLKI